MEINIVKNRGASDSTLALIEEILNHETYISNQTTNCSNNLTKYKATHDGMTLDTLDETFIYTTYTYTKGNILIGIIIIYNAYSKEFRTILTSRYRDNQLDIIGYLKTLEYAIEEGAKAVKIYTDNEVPNLINKGILNKWLSLDCRINNEDMPMKPFIYSIMENSMKLDKEPYTKKLNIRNNKILKLLKNIAVKIVLNQVIKIRGQNYLKVRREDLDLEIAKQSLDVFSKQVIIFENNDIDLESN